MSEPNKKIKALDIYVSPEGKAPGKTKAASVKLTAEDLDKEYTFDVHADLVSDGKPGHKVSSFKLKWDSDIPPPIENKEPVAKAGIDINVKPGDEVILDATDSYDPEGEPLQYHWTQIGGSVAVQIINAKGAQATFIAPKIDDPPEGGEPLAILKAPSVVEAGKTVRLDATGSKFDTISIKQTGGVAKVTLENISELVKQFTAPDGNDALEFEATAKIGPIKESIAQVAIQVVKEDIPNPPSGDYPIPVQWFYNSDKALSKDDPAPTKKYLAAEAPLKVCFPSSASGADAHPVKDKWMTVMTGGGNGRTYWNYNNLKEMMEAPKAGFAYAKSGTFILGQADNLSLKDGNHGTNDWELDGKLFFGGFGCSFHETEMGLKAEYYHNVQGTGVDIKYPSGKKLSRTKETRFFITMIANTQANTVTGDAWLDFGDGKGWTKTGHRVWTKTDWKPGNSVPSGQDKQQILDGPGKIKRHHSWTRANAGNVKIKNVNIGIPQMIPQLTRPEIERMLTATRTTAEAQEQKLTFRLQVIDDHGNKASDDVNVIVVG